MEYAVFGNTGLRVSRLSFGASALGGVFGPADEAEGVRAVHAALDHGITYFDVAPAYGAGMAESVLGKALKRVPRDRYVLSTKAGKNPDASGPEGFFLDYGAASIRAGLDDSARRLGVDWFDIVYLHDIEYLGRAHTEAALSEGLEALQDLSNAGRVRHIGVGMYPIDLWDRVIRTVPIAAALVHNHHTLNDDRLLGLLPRALEKGIGVVNGSPFASGLLTDREPASWHPAPPEDRDVFQRARQLCAQHDMPIAKLALQFSSQNPEIPTTLFSASSADKVKKAVRWHEEPYDRPFFDHVRAILSPVLNREWNYDAALPAKAGGK